MSKYRKPVELLTPERHEKIKQLERARDERLRTKRRLQGKCIICGKRDPIDGMEGCAYCYDLQAEYNAELQKGRRALGFCIQCGEPADKNKKGKFHARCKLCRKYQRLWLRKKRAEVKKQSV